MGSGDLMDLMARMAAVNAALIEINKHLRWIDDRLYELHKRADEQPKQDGPPTALAMPVIVDDEPPEVGAP